MTEDQEAMWKVLANDAEFLCHKWAKELSLLKGNKFHTTCDNYLRFIIDNFTVDEAPRILMTWLKSYRLPLDADKLTSFDAFHNKFGKHIVDEIKNIKAYE